MAESVDSYVRQLLDNTQYLAAKEKEVKEEERLKAIRAAGGKEGVKAYQSIQRAEEQRARSAAQQEKYLRDLRLRANAEQEKAAKKAAADMEGGAFGFAGSDIDALAANSAKAAAGVAAVGAAAAGTVLALNSGAEAILAIDDASRRLTVGRDTILALAQAGEQTGVTFSQIEGLLENLPERITQAARGGNEYAESFERLGVAVTDANGKTRDADGVLRDLLGSLAGLESQTEKAGLAQELLSDVGLALVQTGALDSKAALDQYLTSVGSSVIITDDAVVSARNWRGALSDVGKQVKAVKVDIFDAFGDDAAQIIDNVSLALEYLRTVGFEKLENKVEEVVGAMTFFWDAVSGDISFKEADERLKALRVEMKAEEDAAWDGVEAFYAQRTARREAAVAAGEAGEATTKLTKSTKDAEAAEKDRVAALKEEAKWIDHVNRLENTRRNGLEGQIDELTEIANAAKIAAAAEGERIAMEAQASRDKAMQIAQEARRFADGADERKRIETELQAALRAINEEEIAEFQKVEDEKTKIAKAAAEERAKAAVETAINTLSATAEASAEIAEAIGKENAEAGEKAWKVSQTLAVIEATAAALQAGAKAAAGAAALGPIAAGIAGAATFALVEGAYVAKLTAMETPTFTDTPAGGFRFTGESNTIQGAANDTAILFRDPLEGFQQALDVFNRRQAPTSTPTRGGRDLVGRQAATTPVSRLLTRDVERVTRGRI